MVCLGSSVCKGKRRNNVGVMQRRADTAERGDEGVARILDMTNGIGADSVLECVGTQEAMLQAIRVNTFLDGTSIIRRRI